MRSHIKNIIYFLPVLLLVFVACNQIWLHHSAGLSAWSGGGFGMFSTTDAGGNRILRAFTIQSGVKRELDIPDYLDEEVLKTVTLPTTRNFNSLAQRIAKLPTPDEGKLLSIIIEVWAIHYDRKTLAPSVSLFRRFEMQANEM